MPDPKKSMILLSLARVNGDKQLAALESMAVHAAQLSEWKNGIEKNKAIILIDPSNINALNRLGRCYFELGNFAEAQKIYEAVLQIRPKNKIARNNLDRVHKALQCHAQKDCVVAIEELKGIKFERESAKALEQYEKSFQPSPDSLQTRGNLSKRYREVIEAALAAFVCNGDNVACTGVFICESGTCQLCGHKPIKWHYILENLRNNSRLCVGSECIQNYQVILSEWGYKPAYIVFPYCLQGFTAWILEKNERSIIFNDNIVSFYEKSNFDLYKSIAIEHNLKMFRYIERVGESLFVRSAEVPQAKKVKRSDDIRY